MIPCAAYGMNITDAQCREARIRFYLRPICGDCRREELVNEILLETIIKPGLSPPSGKVGGMLRSGPTIASGLQLPVTLGRMPLSVSNIGPGVISQKEQKNMTKIMIKPRCPCPPGMTKAVARALGYDV